MKRTSSNSSTRHSHKATPSDAVSLKIRVPDRSDGAVSKRIMHKVFPAFSSSSSTSFNSGGGYSDEEPPSSSSSSGRSSNSTTPDKYPELRKVLWHGIGTPVVEPKSISKPKGSSSVSCKLIRKAAKIVMSIFSPSTKKEDDSSSAAAAMEGFCCSSHRENDVVYGDQGGRRRAMFSLRDLSVQI